MTTDDISLSQALTGKRLRSVGSAIGSVSTHLSALASIGGEGVRQGRRAVNLN